MTTSQPVVTRSNSAHVSSQPKAFKKTGILYEDLYADSYLEYLFLRWVLTPLTRYEIIDRISPQCEVRVSGKQYQIDYAFIGQERRFVVELDGYTEHSNKYAFTRDRSRDNDLLVDGWDVLRFSFDAVQEQTGNCIFQLQGAFSKDPLLRTFLIDKPQVTRPDYTDEEWEKIKSYKINCCIRNPLNLKLFNPGPSREELVLQLANLQVEQERLTTEFASELNTTKSSLTRVEQKAHHYGLLTSQQQQENQKLSEKVEALTTSLAKAVEKSAEQALLIEQLKQQVSLLEKLSLQYYQMGNTLDQIKNLEKPKTPLETRLQEEPTLEVSSSGVANYTNENTFRSQFKLAVETAKAAKIKDAHTQFKVLLKQYPNDTSLLHWLAFTSSERQEAKAYLDKIKVINPKHPQLEMAYEWLAKLPSS